MKKGEDKTTNAVKSISAKPLKEEMDKLQAEQIQNAENQVHNTDTKIETTK